MWLNGFGFPRHLGGLMYWGDTIGARQIHDRVAEWSGDLGNRWAPARLLSETAEADGKLCDIEGRL
jgi:3-hydroxyacyl-CoA dehydrogenase